MICSKCGILNDQESKTCKNCGNELVSNSNEVANEQMVNQNSNQEFVNNIADNSNQLNNMNEVPNNSPASESINNPNTQEPVNNIENNTVNQNVNQASEFVSNQEANSTLNQSNESIQNNNQGFVNNIADNSNQLNNMNEVPNNNPVPEFVSNQNNQGVNNNTLNNTPNTNVMDNNISNNNQVKPKKKKSVGKILAIVLGILVIIAGVSIAGVMLLLSSQKKMVCKSDDANITIMYNDKSITGYTASGLTYDLSAQKKVAKNIGMKEYIKEFNEWFTNNTSGTCTANGRIIKKSISKTDNLTTKSNSDKTKIVGDKNYGYVTVPETWNKFYDTDGNDSLQYSYANVFIVSLNVLDGQSSAKNAASNFMINRKNSDEVTDVTGATVKIGKNKEYNAYQVYMYYPASAKYLITYWFESEDGKVRYIALEGPGELDGVKLTKYKYIPESFSLEK